MIDSPYPWLSLFLLFSYLKYSQTAGFLQENMGRLSLCVRVSYGVRQMEAFSMKFSENLVVDLLQKSDILHREPWFEFFAFVETLPFPKQISKKA